MLILYKGEQFMTDNEILFEKRMNRARNPEIKAYWREKWIEALHSGYQELIKEMS